MPHNKNNFKEPILKHIEIIEIVVIFLRYVIILYIKIIF
jgi:hypothetical protein